jgi:hypothetical protein
LDNKQNMWISEVLEVLSYREQRGENFVCLHMGSTVLFMWPVCSLPYMYIRFIYYSDYGEFVKKMLLNQTTNSIS